MHVQLLATPGPGSLFRDLIPWIGALIGAVIIGWIIIVWVRRSVSDQGAQAAVGFTLHDLRELHKSGELTDEEYARAREKMIGRLKRAAEQQAGSENRPEGDRTKV